MFFSALETLLCNRDTTVDTDCSRTQEFERRACSPKPEREMSTWEKRIESAKSKHRPKLKNWSRDGFASTRASDFEALRNMDGVDPAQNPIDRVHCSELTYEEFVERYERPELPVVIGGIPEAEGWRAWVGGAGAGAAGGAAAAAAGAAAEGPVGGAEEGGGGAWAAARLRRQYGDAKFKCGEDDDGYSVKVRMKHFLDYVERQADDSPLYVFDSGFDDKKETAPLLGDFAVPSYFPEDLFQLVGERKRPPYRWFLVGPKRSGTSVHIDPLGTSAWNTVVSGIKRWVLFPPGTAKHVVKGKHVMKSGEDDEPINYFVDFLPRMRKDVNLKAMEFLQYPGETIYVPCNWWHAVLNLTDTIAVTQNFCSRQNFDGVWRKSRSGRKGMSRRWYRLLEEHHPDLAARAAALNRADGYAFDAWAKRSRAEREAAADEEKRVGKHHRDAERPRRRSRSRSRRSSLSVERKKRARSGSSSRRRSRSHSRRSSGRARKGGGGSSSSPGRRRRRRGDDRSASSSSSSSRRRGGRGGGGGGGDSSSSSGGGGRSGRKREEESGGGGRRRERSGSLSGSRGGEREKSYSSRRQHRSRSRSHSSYKKKKKSSHKYYK